MIVLPPPHSLSVLTRVDAKVSAASLSLTATFVTKHTPLFAVRFTPRNLLLVAGPYKPPAPPVVP